MGLVGCDVADAGGGMAQASRLTDGRGQQAGVAQLGFEVAAVARLGT